MLSSLDIENIAVIEKAEISFSDGLNVLTGETGAGKSILVDAINAVLGERTSKELVRHGADNAYVTAVFENVNTIVYNKLDELGIDVEDGEELIISRKISAQGKSACRINGKPSTVSMLKELGETLVNIHGQHDSQKLLNPDYHYAFLDMTGDEDDYLERYKNEFNRLVTIRRQLKKLTADADTVDRRLELLEYEIKELEEADIKTGEREALQKRRSLLQNAQTVIGVMKNVTGAISGDDDNMGVSSVLLSLQKDVSAITAVDSESKKLYDTLDALVDKCDVLKDLAAERLEAVDYSEGELEKLEERLDLLYRLSTKYGESEEEMLAYLENAKLEKNSIENSDEEIERLNAEYDEAYNLTLKYADELSEYRKTLAKQLESDVKEQLIYLDMPKINFIVDFQKGKLSSIGYDKIEFLISTNPGEPPKPLAKIASGGELSRIMLAIKNIIAQNDNIDTLIFDEIDTGVSGRASRKIGLKLKAVSEHTQVICVTHSAQIASVADTHLLISKEYKNERTYTGVQPLDFDGRKAELARIMGGLEITDTLLKSAEELLNGEQ